MKRLNIYENLLFIKCEVQWIFENIFFPKRLYIKSCALGHTERAYLNSRQQCPLTSGWTMLNSLCLIRWLTLQRRQGRSLICNWADGGQIHRISSTHWVLQLALECVGDCSMFPKPPSPCKPKRQNWAAATHTVSSINERGLHWTNWGQLLTCVNSHVKTIACNFKI